MIIRGLASTRPTPRSDPLEESRTTAMTTALRCPQEGSGAGVNKRAFSGLASSGPSVGLERAGGYAVR
jgi:hypothetical protein